MCLVFFPYYVSQWLQSTYWLPAFFKYIILCSTEDRYLYKFGTWWQTFIFDELYILYQVPWSFENVLWPCLWILITFFMDTNDGMWQDNLIIFGEIYYRNNVFLGHLRWYLNFFNHVKTYFYAYWTHLYQGSSNLDHPTEFSSNPNQTHLYMLIRVFKIINKSQVGEFDQGWS